jgi:hypothetical protein
MLLVILITLNTGAFFAESITQFRPELSLLISSIRSDGSTYVLGQRIKSSQDNI